MNTLPLVLRKNGFTYTQVLRTDRTCIYEQPIAENLKYYEVFTVRISPERFFKGKLFPESEVFPGNEDFGKTAWSCRSYEDALTRFNDLVEKQNQSKDDNQD